MSAPPRVTNSMQHFSSSCAVEYYNLHVSGRLEHWRIQMPHDYMLVHRLGAGHPARLSLVNTPLVEFRAFQQLKLALTN